MTEIEIGEFMCLSCSHIGCNQDDETFYKCLKEFEKVIEKDLEQ